MKQKGMASIIILVTTSVLLASCATRTPATPAQSLTPTIPANSVVIAEGRVEPVRFAEVGLNAGGLVTEVVKKEGEKVNAGDVVARLKNNEALTLQSAQAAALQSLTKAYQDVRDAQFKLDEFDVPSDFSGMTPTQAVQDSLNKLNLARDAFEPYKSLSDKKLKLTGAEEENPVLRNTAKRLNKELDDAWSKYRKAVEWLNDQSAVETAKAGLAQAQKDYNSLLDSSFAEDTAGVRAALANAEVRAPFSGMITNLDLKVGEFAASGIPVATIADLSDWVIKTTDLTEMDVVNIQEGQPVTFTLDALPNKSLKGYVLTVAQNYTERQSDIVYKVTILVSDKDPAIRWGMTAEVKFTH